MSVIIPVRTPAICQNFVCTVDSSNHTEGVITQCLQLHWPKLVKFNKGGGGTAPNKCCILISNNCNFHVISVQNTSSRSTYLQMWLSPSVT